MRVAFIAAECEPWAKTGGLGDVVDALARAIGRARLGTDAIGPVDVYLPRYRDVSLRDAPVRGERLLRVPDPGTSDGLADVRLVDVEGDGYRVRLVEHPAAFDREGFYGDAAGDYPDNGWRFGLFCRTALEAIRAEGGADLIHLHDWHAAPALLLRDGPYRGDPSLGSAAVLFTIHNLAFHGYVPADRVWSLGLGGPSEIASGAGIDLLRAAIQHAELVNTVSPTFAAEATRPEFGMGLDDVLRDRGDRFFGILNGIDPEIWNPTTDEALAAPYGADDLAGKSACRRALAEISGFDVADARPILGAIGRLDPQKGFDLLADGALELLHLGARLVVQANGDARLAEPFRRLAAARPEDVAFVERFDRAMARRIYAGSDLFVMPSRFEPSGQGQMIALRYGTPPIVRRTGGLADSVIDVLDDPDRGTGFAFGPPEVGALVEACRQALELRGDGRNEWWTALVRRGMKVDFSWESGPAPRYLEAYHRALDLRAAAGGVPAG
jgi:starch synthase